MITIKLLKGPKGIGILLEDESFYSFHVPIEFSVQLDNGRYTARAEWGDHVFITGVWNRGMGDPVLHGVCVEIMAHAIHRMMEKRYGGENISYVGVGTITTIGSG